MAYSLHDLWVEGISLTGIGFCVIENQMGEHGILKLQGYFEDEAALYELPENSPVQVWAGREEEKELLFSGVVTELTVSAYAGVRQAVAEAKSWSWLLDQAKKSRSFQNPGLGYKELVARVLADYPGSNCFYAAPEAEVGRLIVQYEETDWEFLQRVLSRIGAVLTPDCCQEGIRLYAGIPQFPEEKVFYRILKMEKDMGSCYAQKANGNPVHGADFTRYWISSGKRLGIFGQVLAGGGLFTVFYCRYEFDREEMTGIYGLQPTGGLLVLKKWPMHLIGVALSGTVAGVSGDQVQVMLDIDRENGGTADYWMPYSTLSASPDGSGWYCMPEIGDRVRVYFPSKKEQEAVALSAVSGYKGAERMNNPNARYLKTKSGQELALVPGHLKLSCGGASSLSIGEDGSVSVSAASVVQVCAKGNVTIQAGEELVLQANKNLQMSSTDGGTVMLEPQIIRLQGSQVTLD